MKKIKIFLIIITIFLVSCQLPNNVKDSSKLADLSEKYPLITNFYLESLSFEGLFILQKHNLGINVPTLNITFESIVNKKIHILCTANAIIKKINILELDYDIVKGEGIYTDPDGVSHELKKYSMDKLLPGFKSDDFIKYINSIFLIFTDQWDILYSGSRFVDGDLTYNLNDEKLVSSIESKSSVHSLHIDYYNYQKFGLFLNYPKIIEFSAMDTYEGKIMLKNLKYTTTVD